MHPRIVGSCWAILAALASALFVRALDQEPQGLIRLMAVAILAFGWGAQLWWRAQMPGLPLAAQRLLLDTVVVLATLGLLTAVVSLRL